MKTTLEIFEPDTAVLRAGWNEDLFRVEVESNHDNSIRLNVQQAAQLLDALDQFLFPDGPGKPDTKDGQNYSITDVGYDAHAREQGHYDLPDNA